MTFKSNAREVVGRLNAYGDALPTAWSRGVLVGARTFSQVAESELARDIGSDLVMSGLGRRKKRRFRLRAQVGKQYGSNENPSREVRAVPPGAWAIVERGAKPHLVGRGRRKMNRRETEFLAGGTTTARGRDLRTFSRNRAVLVIGGQVVTGPIRHPGTSGKHPWARAEVRARPLVTKAFHREMSAPLVKLFKGR